MTPSNRSRRRAILPLFCLLCLMSAAMPLRAQYLYPEHYTHDGSSFCLDCGDVKAQYPADYPRRLASAFGSKAKQASGTILVQILIDPRGNARLLSADNRSVVASRKLRLEKAFASIPWHPALPSRSASASGCSWPEGVSRSNASISSSTPPR